MEKYNDNEFMFPAGAEVNIIPVMQGEGPLRINDSELPDVIPVLALRTSDPDGRRKEYPPRPVGPANSPRHTHRRRASDS